MVRCEGDRRCMDTMIHGNVLILGHDNLMPGQLGIFIMVGRVLRQGVGVGKYHFTKVGGKMKIFDSAWLVC